jgi:hypothetical protein
MFQEEDSKLFGKVVTIYHQYFCMFHGSITKLYEEKLAKDELEDFKAIVDDFTHNFNKYFFSKDYVKNLMWNLCF